MTFALGSRSLGFCSRVDPQLMRVVARALTLSMQDAGVTAEQTRTPEEEAALMAAGESHTLKSHHIIGYGTAAPGCSGAIDLVPWTGTSFVWEWPRCAEIAVAMRQASLDLSIPVTWGGIWNTLLGDVRATDPEAMLAASNGYVALVKTMGNAHPFVDGPHFELGKN